MLVRSTFFSVALSAVFLDSSSNAMPNFVWLVPNGAYVPESPAIGHDMSDFPGRNAFGRDFEDAAIEWTKELCETDSDQDGQTNGQELGDPCCGQRASLRSGPRESRTQEMPRKPRIRHYGPQLAVVQPRLSSPSPKAAKVTGPDSSQTSIKPPQNAISWRQIDMTLMQPNAAVQSHSFDNLRGRASQLSSMASFVHVLRELAQVDEREGLDLFLQTSTNVEKDLETLFELQEFVPQVPQDAMLRSVEALPEDRWIISACDIMLKRSERWDSWAVALVLRKAMQRAVGQTLMTAEILWARGLSLAARALACSSPVTITSVIGDNVLYVAGSSYSFKNNQSPFCWKGPWANDEKKELKRLIPVRTGTSDFYIVSVYAQEFLYASDFPVTSDAEGFAMKRVLVKRGNDLPQADKIWRLQLLEDGKCAFYNDKHDAFLSSPPEAGDGSRRTVVTAPFCPLDEKRSARREWRIRASGSMLEMALVQFFARKYSKTVELFTGILAKDEISAADRRKVLCYRMAANLLLKNDGCFKQDLTQVEELGGYPDYFFDTLAGNLTDQDQELLRQRHNLEEEWKREEEGVKEKLSKFAVENSHNKTDPSARSPYVFFFNDLCQQVRDENPTKNVVGDRRTADRDVARAA